MSRAPHWKAALVLALVLASGIGLGIAIDRVFLARRGALPPGEFMSPWRMGRVLARLDLTPDQRARIEEILADRRRDLARVREDVRPELERIRIATEADVRAVLTPDQTRQFDRNLERIRRFGAPWRGWDRGSGLPGGSRRHRGPGPHGGPHPGAEGRPDSGDVPGESVPPPPGEPAPPPPGRP
jgi:Spy/CpxP family protein refolding chaperone